MDGLKERLSTNDLILDALNLGVIVLGHTGGIEHMNIYARNLIDQDKAFLSNKWPRLWL